MTARMILRSVWMRGWLVVPVASLLWLGCLGAWIVFQAPSNYSITRAPARTTNSNTPLQAGQLVAKGAPPVRCALARGGEVVTWRTGPTRSGRLAWSLGVLIDQAGAARWGLCGFSWKPRNLGKGKLVWLPEYSPGGQIVFPLWLLAVVSPAVPLSMGHHARCKRTPGVCGSCGYDLLGGTGGPCPECGAVDPHTTGTGTEHDGSAATHARA